MVSDPLIVLTKQSGYFSMLYRALKASSSIGRALDYIYGVKIFVTLVNSEHRNIGVIVFYIPSPTVGNPLQSLAVMDKSAWTTLQTVYDYRR